MLHFFKKVKKNTRRSHYFTPVYQNSRWCDLQFLRYGAWRTEICIRSFSVFHLLPPLKTATIKILKKWKLFLKISSFYTCVPKFKIMWCTVLEIRSETDWIPFHFGIYQHRVAFKGALSGLRQLLTTESPLKMMKNVFYFTSKVLTLFSRYLSFCLYFLATYQNSLLKKIRLISNFMMTQPG